MPLPRNVYDADLLVNDQVVEVRRITLSHADELRGELEAHKRSIPTLPHALTSLMLWAACVREGRFAGDYAAWKNGGLIEFRKVRADELTPVEQEGIEAAVGPTAEAVPSGPASPSPTTSPVPPTGSPAYPSTTA